jgi:hypothetical protein
LFVSERSEFELSDDAADSVLAMSHHHHTISPIERDCVCLMRGPSGAHIAQCDEKYRAKFFGAWGAERLLFYGQPGGRVRTRTANDRQTA